MLSGCQRKIYMTIAQLKLAKHGHAASLMFSRAFGVMRNDSGCWLGAMESLPRASITRAKT